MVEKWFLQKARKTSWILKVVALEDGSERHDGERDGLKARLEALEARHVELDQLEV